MLERDLKVIAMQMAAHLPDDEETTRRVYALLGELIDGWLYSRPKRPAGISGSGAVADSNVHRFKGNADISPR